MPETRTSGVLLNALLPESENSLSRILQYDDQTFELSQQISGSGFRYEAGDISLVGKGQDATLVLGDSLTLKLTERK